MAASVAVAIFWCTSFALNLFFIYLLFFFFSFLFSYAPPIFFLFSPANSKARCREKEDESKGALFKLKILRSGGALRVTTTTTTTTVRTADNFIKRNQVKPLFTSSSTCLLLLLLLLLLLFGFVRLWSRPNELNQIAIKDFPPQFSTLLLKCE